MASAAKLVIGLLAALACLAASAAQQAAGACKAAAQGRTAGGSAADHVLLQHRSAASLSVSRGVRVAAAEAEECHTLLEGEPCYSDAHWAWMHGIFDFPQWYPHLSPASPFEDFQALMHMQKPEVCPRPCAVAQAPSGGEACVSRAVSLDFFSAEVSHSNLGGLGPDAGSPDIRYRHVGKSGGKPFDLVVTATSSYESNVQERNGLVRDGKYGVINVKSGTRADLRFSFVDSASNMPVLLEALHFSVLDLDQSKKVEERIYVDGFENYTLNDPTEVAVDTAADGTLVFKSTRLGFGCDNPRDPLALGEVTCNGQTVDQRSRAVTFLFSNASSLDMTVEAACAGGCGSGGRNFLFSGSSSLAYSCDEAPRLGLCAIFGDPHFVTFDGAHTVLMEDRVIWLVRSSDVWIQALSKGSAGYFQGLAIGGPFVGNRTLLVVRDTASSLHASLDGDAILTDSAGEFVVKGVVEGYRSETWNATLHNEEVLKVRTEMQFSVGPWPERFLTKPVGGLLLFKLPGGVEVTVTGEDWMTAVITMPQQPGGQGGYCGNFNGEQRDDFEPGELSFHKALGSDLEAVAASEVLFSAEWLGSQLLQRAGATKHDPDSTMQNCSAELRAKAEERCKVVTDARLRGDCIFDICATGLADAAEGILAAEILEEKVNARGIPVFKGSGRCTDTVGQRYAAFNTSVATVKECTDVLRSLALTWGVVGAQIYRDSACQILVHNGTDPTHVSIRGGWGPKSAELGQGIGMVSNTSGDEGWACWQVV